MIKKLAERLVESQHRWLIVTGVTFVISLASLAPQVDQLYKGRLKQTELLAELTQASEAESKLPLYRKRVEEESETLQQLQSRQVDEAGVKGLRSWLVSVARQAGCRVRRLDLSDPTSRPWDANSSPLTPPDDPKKKTPYQLEIRSAMLSVTGAEPELLALLRVLDQDGRMKHTNSLELSPTGRNATEMQLDVTLWYFALAESARVS